MALIIPLHAFCPKCRKSIQLVLIEPHPTRDDVAHHIFDCARCGPVLTIVENISEETAEVIEIEIDYLRTIARISRVMASA
jgi:hypothetical protein